VLLSLLSLYFPSGGPAPAPPAIVGMPLPSDSDGAPPKHSVRAPFISAHQLAAVQPVKVTKVPDWLLQAYLLGEIDEEEFAVFLALQ